MVPCTTNQQVEFGENKDKVVLNVGTLVPPTKNAFIHLDELPSDRRTCEFCEEAFSNAGVLLNYPVRLPCSCIFCYGCCLAWLGVYRDCPEDLVVFRHLNATCDAPWNDPSKARKSIDVQIERCRQHFKAQAMIEGTAALRLQRTQNRRASTKSCSRNQSSDVDPARENVLAALTLLDVQPSQIKAVDMGDLEAALSLMDLRDENTVEQLPDILRSMSSW